MPKVKDLYAVEKRWIKVCYKSYDTTVPELPDSFDDTSYNCFCLAGALHLCYPDTSSRLEVKERVLKYIYNYSSKQIYNSIEGWNDAPERTFDEVKKLVEALDI